jgi:hypothetical protein
MSTFVKVIVGIGVAGGILFLGGKAANFFAKKA